MTTTSDVSEELARLADKSHTPGSRPGSRCRPLEVVRHPDSKSPPSQSAKSPQQATSRRDPQPARQPTAAVTEGALSDACVCFIDDFGFIVIIDLYLHLDFQDRLLQCSINRIKHIGKYYWDSLFQLIIL